MGRYYTTILGYFEFICLVFFGFYDISQMGYQINRSSDNNLLYYILIKLCEKPTSYENLQRSYCMAKKY
jgi:hypothetical protein